MDGYGYTYLSFVLRFCWWYFKWVQSKFVSLVFFLSFLLSSNSIIIKRKIYAKTKSQPKTLLVWLFIVLFQCPMFTLFLDFQNHQQQNLVFVNNWIWVRTNRCTNWIDTNTRWKGTEKPPEKQKQCRLRYIYISAIAHTTAETTKKKREREKRNL